MSARSRRPWVIGVLAAAVWPARPGPARAAVVVCPAETYPSSDEWRAAVADASAPKVQALLADHATDLMATPDGGLLSLRQAAAGLSDPALVAAYRTQFDPAARRLLAEVRGRPAAGPADLYAVAVRYPLSTVAAQARAAAAARALDQGDVDAARALDPAVVAGRVPDGSPAAVGPLPFDAPWHARLNAFGMPRVVPVGSADVAVVADDGGAMALRADGTVLWRWAPARPAVPAAFRAGDTGRGPLCVPAILADLAGRPQLLAVRNGTALAVLRAADGRLFWTTAGDPTWADLTVLSPPTVAGRLVLVVGLSVPDPDHADTGTLQLVAADVTDGRVLWRATLGTVSDPLRKSGGQSWRQREPEVFRDAAPPTVAGDLVVVPDNAGAVVAVDRFGGDVRWARPYPPAATGGASVRHYNDGRNDGRGVLPPLPRAALLRWSAAAVACGDVLFVAPQDAAPARGLDRRTGRVLWQTSALPDDATCVGVAGGRFILGGGGAVTAVDPAGGTAAWTYVPAAGVHLTGPPAVRDGRVFVRSTAGLLEVTDSAGRPAADVADFHTVASSGAGKAALAGAGLAGAFDPG